MSGKSPRQAKVRNPGLKVSSDADSGVSQARDEALKFRPEHPERKLTETYGVHGEYMRILRLGPKHKPEAPNADVCQTVHIEMTRPAVFQTCTETLGCPQTILTVAKEP